MDQRTPTRVSLTALLGTPVTDAQGQLRGKLKDIAVATGPDGGKVAGLVLKTRTGLSIVPSQEVMETPAGTLELRSPRRSSPSRTKATISSCSRTSLTARSSTSTAARWSASTMSTWNGRARARPTFCAWPKSKWTCAERFAGSSKGVCRAPGSNPSPASSAPAPFPGSLSMSLSPIPARRVKLRIEHERLAGIHPSELADILEDLAPAEREAVFTSLDEEVAAETLEEVEPKLQKALLEKLDEERIADIVEEMDPGAAADLLAELSEEQSDAILEEMEPEERQEVEELLEFDEDSAAGCMTTDFVYLGMDATVAQAVQALRSFDGDPESVTEVFLLDEKRMLRGAIPLARLVMAQPETQLSRPGRASRPLLPADMHQNELAEMFDKYNLHALPVVDSQGRMVGVVQAEHVISFLREKL